MRATATHTTTLGIVATEVREGLVETMSTIRDRRGMTHMEISRAQHLPKNASGTETVTDIVIAIRSVTINDPATAVIAIGMTGDVTETETGTGSVRRTRTVMLTMTATDAPDIAPHAETAIMTEGIVTRTEMTDITSGATGTETGTGIVTAREPETETLAAAARSQAAHR